MSFFTNISNEKGKVQCQGESKEIDSMATTDDENENIKMSVDGEEAGEAGIEYNGDNGDKEDKTSSDDSMNIDIYLNNEEDEEHSRTSYYYNTSGYGSTTLPSFNYPKLKPLEYVNTSGEEAGSGSEESSDGLYPKINMRRRQYSRDSISRASINEYRSRERISERISEYRRDDDNDEDYIGGYSMRRDSNLRDSSGCNLRSDNGYNLHNNDYSTYGMRAEDFDNGFSFRRDPDSDYSSSGYRFRRDSEDDREESPYRPRSRLTSDRYVSESSLSSPSTPEPITGKLSRQEGGMVGLRNLGNTCYLNSTLQCLTAAAELSYRLAEEYESGTLLNSSKTERSKLFLNAIGRLFHEMWQAEGKVSSISRTVEPRQFKSVLGMIDSRFSGYRQEDSQEALAIILDRLHEDLKTSIAETDDITADNSDKWEMYCKKENSIVRELFHGQLRSTVKCSNCSFESETFDPFCFLNLPIPLKDNSGTNDIAEMAEFADTEIIRTVQVTNLSDTSSHPSSNAFNVYCYNDKVFNADSAYLIINKHFENLNEFRSNYRGTGYWVIEFEQSKLPLSILPRLPESKSPNNPSASLIVYKADLLQRNYLISFVAGKSGEIVGFPVLIRTKFTEPEELTPAMFIESFLIGGIRPILIHRFPERLEVFDSAVSLMLASPNEYFKIEVVSSGDLIQVKVIILNDKSDFNEMIFFREVDDPNDLFEELVLDKREDEEDERDNMEGVFKEDKDTLEYDSVENPYNSYGSYSTRSSYTPSTITSNSPPFVPNLTDCFNSLCSIETLDWKCEKCCQLGQAEKRLSLWRLPDVLILHLKRFSYGGSGIAYSSYFSSYSSGGAKISRAVDFGLEIDLKEVLCELAPAQSTRYELFGISQHFGSLHFGHYTALVKHEASGKWFLADDGSITVYENEEEWFKERVKEAAYVLFYRRIK